MGGMYYFFLYSVYLCTTTLIPVTKPYILCIMKPCALPGLQLGFPRFLFWFRFHFSFITQVSAGGGVGWLIEGLAPHYFAKLNITIIQFCLSRFLITILSLVWWQRSATTSQINISTCQKIMSNCETICHLLVIIISVKSTYM